MLSRLETHPKRAQVPAFITSRWILTSFSKVLCMFIAKRIIDLCTREELTLTIRSSSGIRAWSRLEAKWISTPILRQCPRACLIFLGRNSIAPINLRRGPDLPAKSHVQWNVVRPEEVLTWLVILVYPPRDWCLEANMRSLEGKAEGGIDCR
jgi:hypothetical protein